MLIILFIISVLIIVLKVSNTERQIEKQNKEMQYRISELKIKSNERIANKKVELERSRMLLDQQNEVLNLIQNIVE